MGMFKGRLSAGHILPVALATNGLDLAPKLGGIRAVKIMTSPASAIAKGLMGKIEAVDGRWGEPNAGGCGRGRWRNKRRWRGRRFGRR